jgi:arylsulfatase A-like enzyme
VTHPQRPNIVLILNDDMGYSDLGCYGGEVQTPHLDRLAAGGLRFSQFYNTARCSPSRASLLTGLHPHQTGIGILTYDSGPEGYAGNLNRQCVTIAEVLKGGGYRTYMSGKWHVSSNCASPLIPGPCSAASMPSTAPSSAPAASTTPIR